MLVRRMATVTISAPAASVARRVCSRSLNLPVPVSRRERKGVPAMTRASSPWVGWLVIAPLLRKLRRSAASQGVHDLDPVAVLQRVFGMLAARHDRAVDLHRHLAPRQV